MTYQQNLILITTVVSLLISMIKLSFTISWKRYYITNIDNLISSVFIGDGVQDTWIHLEFNL